MKSERIIWGLIFLFIGGILLLENYEIIHFNWDIIWKFWPLILIVTGVNMLFSREDSARAGIISIIVTIAALSFIGYQGTKPENSRTVWAEHHEDHEEDEDYRNENDMPGKTLYSEAYTPGLNQAELNIKGGAAKFTLSDTTAQLFKAEAEKGNSHFSLLKKYSDSTAVLTFKMSGKQSNKGSFHGNDVVLKLNAAPVWDVNLEFGAGQTDFDFSQFKVRNVSFKGGAASFKVKLGQPLSTTAIKTETGASEIEISIPESAACLIKVDSGLSSNDFEGFIKQADGSYVTPDFKASSNKFILDLQGGLSKFEVNRY